MCKSLASVTLPNSITLIEERAFFGCSSITEIVVPEGVRVIGDYAFYECSNLSDITVPSTLEDAGSNVFSQTAWLKAQPENEVVYIGDYVYGTRSSSFDAGEELVLRSGVKGIFGYAFNVRTVKKVTIPNSVKWIAKYAFYNCKLQEFDLGSGVQRIGERAFASNSTLKTIVVPANVTEVESDAFTWTKNVESVTVASANTQFGEYVFSYCGEDLPSDKTLQVSLPSNMTSIPIGMFYRSGIGDDFVIPASVTRLEKSCFYKCRFTKLTLGSNIKFIGSGALGELKIELLEIPATVEQIDDAAFQYFSGSIKFNWTLEELRTKAVKQDSNHWFEYAGQELVISYIGGTLKPYHAAVEETCTEPGNIAYYEEILTGKAYSGNAYSKEITAGITVPAGCKGGTATCEECAVCAVCGNEYGEPLGHSFNKWSVDGSQHWKACTRTGCNGKSEVGDHSFDEGLCGTCNTYDTFGTEGLEYEYNRSAETWKVKAYTGTAVDIVIPYYHQSSNGFERGIVTEIGKDVFLNNTSLKSIVFNGPVESIGEAAFKNCIGLESITLPSTLKSIGKSAFEGASLKNLIMPNTVTNVGDAAFKNCTALESITLSNTLRYLASEIFAGCEALESISFPRSIAAVHSDAFEGCTGLTAVHAEDLTAWANCSFADKTTNPLYLVGHLTVNGEYVKEVTLSEGATRVGDYAFYNCTDITSVTIPSTVTSIGSGAFGSCGAIASFTSPVFGSTYRKLFAGCFDDEYFPGSIKVDEYYVPASLKTLHVTGTTIEQSAFEDWTQLETVTIDNLTSIPFSAFRFCVGLTSITLPGSLESIADNAFDCCYRLTEVCNLSSLELIAGKVRRDFGGIEAYLKGVIKNPADSKLSMDENGYIIYTDGDEKSLVGYRGTARDLTLPSGITEVKGYAFYTSITISSVVIPEGVNKIGTYGFFTCSVLSSVTLPSTLTTIEKDAFYNCYGLVEVYNNSNISIVAGQYDSSNGRIGEYALRVITDGASSYLATDADGFVIYDDGVNKVLVGYRGTATELTVPNGVTAVRSAFYGNEKLKSVVLPESVKSIEGYAFYQCAALESINLPSGLTSIGRSAFYRCFSLNNVVFPNTLESIDAYAFYQCTSLASVTLPSSLRTLGEDAFYACRSLKSLVILEGLTLLPYRVFSDCTALESVTLPTSLREIQAFAFNNTTALQTLTIPEGVTSVGDVVLASSWTQSALRTIYLPGSLETFKWRLPSGVEHIYYNGTSEAFLLLALQDKYWNLNLSDNVVIHCSDAELNKEGVVVRVL